MITSSNIHDVERVRAKSSRARDGDDYFWLTVEFASGNSTHTVTAFLPSYDQAKALADAINGVCVPALEAAE